jgi:hypothetical protein
MASVVRLVVIFIGAILLNAKSAMGVESSSTVETCTETTLTFEDWQQWAAITPEPVRSQGHSNNWVGIYTNELAEKTYRSASSPYQTCAKIVKPIYTDSTGQNIRKLTIMVKMPPGYDPENADWWYGVYDASGTKMKRRGKLMDCIPCHKQAAETDYLFSKEVVTALDE